MEGEELRCACLRCILRGLEEDHLHCCKEESIQAVVSVARNAWVLQGGCWKAVEPHAPAMLVGGSGCMGRGVSGCSSGGHLQGARSKMLKKVGREGYDTVDWGSEKGRAA